ncbi:YfiT family bacillithiol transferase [Gorillibacterium massiliense]|uniref:YfiT family bacillithiol transferase n=1 Tax=Gorillibacterium massiliense TaxID=1280390 RepID=UPI0004AD0277|nr:bacillithiol transferase BstA [Gorillibacterium massiliense]
MNVNLSYPIGRFTPPDVISEEQINEWIREIADLPMVLRRTVESLSVEQLDTPYREGGWTIRQVVHHLAESHLNSFIRFKLALTEENPTIKPYDEQRWAELPDTKNMPIEASLTLLTGLHQRWVFLLATLAPEDLQKTFYHPESKETVKLAKNVGIYAWHGRHHLAHITGLLERMGWV